MYSEKKKKNTNKYNVLVRMQNIEWKDEDYAYIIYLFINSDGKLFNLAWEKYYSLYDTWYYNYF